MIDNVESILPPYGWAAGAGGEEPAGFDPDLLEEILGLCRKLVETGGTSLVFTSRSPLSVPFDDRGRELDVGRLSKSEALELVGKVLGEGGRIPGTRTDLESREKVEDLVEALGGHARSLVLIARELRRAKAQRHHGRYSPDHGRPAPAVPERPRAEPLRQRGTLPAQAAARAARQAAAAGCIPRRGECRGPSRRSWGSTWSRASTKPWPGRSSTSAWPRLLEYNYLRFDPALGPFLLRELDDPARAAAEARWADATAQLTGFLYEQQCSDPQMAAALTLQELPNLLAALEWRSRAAAGGAIGVESVIDQASSRGVPAPEPGPAPCPPARGSGARARGRGSEGFWLEPCPLPGRIDAPSIG